MEEENKKKEIIELLDQFQSLGCKIANLWYEIDDYDSTAYPEYLPSFDEFVMDIGNIKEGFSN